MQKKRLSDIRYLMSSVEAEARRIGCGNVLCVRLNGMSVIDIGSNAVAT
ncbi:hypothetical protein AM587_10000151 [Phytophthora nicotianae]|uniref:Uncharacterized protein n=1 Tax=Phytophthora nicotianae TaxID=4792 RepID=A0A0W8BXF8_PHYNI|nr:hypothetical protein AM587_10000151 [Phytophthora nicotianae]